MTAVLQVVSEGGAGDLPEYPFGVEDRLDSHFFVPWERRRWLNSGMRLRGTAECRALYLDLIWISYDQSPVGTLPDDTAMLAKLLMVDHEHFCGLVRHDFGPLHNWSRCATKDGEVRLYHPMVLRTLTEALARREDHRAKSEAASMQKRLQRLRIMLANYNKELAENDAAVSWIDEWLQRQGVAKRTATQVERALGAWSNHMFDLGQKGRHS
jgi:hypothetical protein